MIHRCLIYLIIFMSLADVADALIPLESLILGDLSKQHFERDQSPINKIFSEESRPNDRSNDPINLYRAFFEDGVSLDNYCKDRPEIRYTNVWEQDQVIRAIMNSLQYVGLTLTTKAIPAYAKQLELSNEEWQNLEDRLIGNYCSKNLTVISLKQLRKNLNIRFTEDNKYNLPSIERNRFFAKKLSKINASDAMIIQELLQTVKLFRAFCSWDGNLESPKLLTPFLNNPIIMSFIIRKISGKTIAIDYQNDTFYFVKDPQPAHIACENIICRKYDFKLFAEILPRAIGTTGIQNDLKRTYCMKMRNYNMKMADKESIIYKWINEQSFDDYNLQLSQFIALISGIPDFFVRTEKFSDAKKFFRFSADQYWTNWASVENGRLDKEIFYEERLTLEKVKRASFFNQYIPRFKVLFDVNLGEFDRALQDTGKIKTVLNLKISKKFLKWIRNEWAYLDKNNKKKRDHLIKVFGNYIEDSLSIFRSKFNFPPWEGDLTSIVVIELLEQLSLYKGNFFNNNATSIVEIPIIIGYGTFALKYINYEYRMKKNKEELDYSVYEYND